MTREEQINELEHELFVAYRHLKAAEAAKAAELEQLNKDIKEASAEVDAAFQAIRDFGTGQQPLFDKKGEPITTPEAEAASTPEKRWTREEVANLNGEELMAVASGLGIDPFQDAAVVMEAILAKAGPIGATDGGSLAEEVAESDLMHPRHRFTGPELAKLNKATLHGVAVAVLGPLEGRPNRAELIRDILAKRDAELAQL